MERVAGAEYERYTGIWVCAGRIKENKEKLSKKDGSRREWSAVHFRGNTYLK